MPVSAFKPPRLVAIGASAGGLVATQMILEGITDHFPAPIVLIEHNRGGLSSDLSGIFRRHSLIPAKEADPGEMIEPGRLYVAPGDYHLLLEKNGELSLSVDDKVNWCRPSIDVFFESAATSWGADVLGVVLTGANKDGALGAQRLANKGARVLIQDPEEAEFAAMPLAAQAAVQPARVYKLQEINKILIGLQEGFDEYTSN